MASATMKRGYTGTQRENDALAALVKGALGHAWAEVELK